MRLQLTAGLVVALASAALATGASPAAAEPPVDQASATVRVYADDDRLSVVSPAAHAQVTTGALTVEADTALDAVSAASVDVVTAASPTPFQERRVEGGLGLAWAATRLVTVRGGAQLSHERDYDAVRLGVGVAAELGQRNTTVEVRTRLGRDHATASDDPTFSGTRTSAALIAALTQVLDRRTIADLTVEGAWADGWHGSPYRQVLVSDPVMPVVTSWREATPERRLSLAVALRLRRALGERWFGTASARGYLDDWSVASATALVGARRRLDDATLIGVELRGYLQDGAFFWRRQQPDGAAPPRYRTADRTLGPMATAGVELVGERAIGGDRRVMLALGGVALWFLDYAPQAERHALTVTMSFTTPL